MNLDLVFNKGKREMTIRCYHCSSPWDVHNENFYVSNPSLQKDIHFCSLECIQEFFLKGKDTNMKEKPEFHYEEFEDYLFNAIQISRDLTADDLSDYDDVMRYLSLAQGEVDSFYKRVSAYHKENEK
jgi:hypothetical protein